MSSDSAIIVVLSCVSVCLPSKHGEGWRKLGSAGFLGMIVSWSHRKIGSNAIAKRNPLAAQPCLTPLSDTPGREELSHAFSCKFDLCGAVAVNHTQEATYELWQLRPLKYVKDPGMVDAGICGSKICQ